MKINKDSNIYVLSFTIILTLVCSAIIASSSYLLRPEQLAQVVKNEETNVLKVSGIPYTSSNVAKNFKKYVIPKYIDVTTGDVVDFNGSYKESDILKDKNNIIPLNSTQDIVGVLKIAKIQKVYYILNDEKEITQIVLPIKGNGLWSVMYAFLAISTDGNTINGITYYSQGETPGLGGEVENPSWYGQFKDKKIFDGPQTNEPSIHIVKSGATGDYQINAISGATLTSNGVENQLKFWLGPLGYGKFLQQLRDKKVNFNE